MGRPPGVLTLSILADRASSMAASFLLDYTRPLIVVLSFVVVSARLLSAASMVGYLADVTIAMIESSCGVRTRNTLAAVYFLCPLGGERYCPVDQRRINWMDALGGEN